MNLIVLMWWVSGILSVWLFLFALIARSWQFSLISAGLFLPIAYYFGGANNAYQLIGLFPLVPILFGCVFLDKEKKANLMHVLKG